MSTSEPTNPTPSFTDDQLIAYLDSALPALERAPIEAALSQDTALAQRLADLSLDTSLMPEAFAPLLSNVPPLNLADIKPLKPVSTAGDHANAPLGLPNPMRSGTLGPRRPAWQASWSMAAGAVMALGLSFMAGRWTEPPTATLAATQTPAATAPTPVDWRVAVVDYQRLYVRETLANGGAPDAQTTTQQLANVSSHSGLTVQTQATQLPGLSFRRAQTLGVQGQPLIQMAYVTQSGDPVALCFTPQATPATPPTPSVIAGMNTVTWNDGKFGFIIVGHVDSATLLRAAQVAAQQLKQTT